MAHPQTPRPTTSGHPPADDRQEAFRELHGRRIHGFALLLTLGDRARAAQLAGDALAAGAARADELSHPERAAAWLRAHVLRAVRRGARWGGGPSRVDLGIDLDHAVLVGLAELGILERAALVADGIERFDRRDVADIVGRRGSGLERLLRRARRRYVAGYASVAALPGSGPLVSRVREIARQAMT